MGFRVVGSQNVFEFVHFLVLISILWLPSKHCG